MLLLIKSIKGRMFMNRTVKHQITGEQITFLETAEETAREVFVY